MTVFFISLFRFFTRRKTLLWILLAIFTGIMLLFAMRIRFQEDITQFIPENDKVKNYTSVLQNIRLNDRLVIAVHLPDTSTIPEPQALIDYGSVLVDQLKQSSAAGLIRDIRFKITDTKVAEGMDVFYRNLPFLLDEADYATIEQKLADTAILEAMQRNYRTLLTPSGVAFKEN
jgi:hypothetical protein